MSESVIELRRDDDIWRQLLTEAALALESGCRSQAAGSGTGAANRPATVQLSCGRTVIGRRTTVSVFRYWSESVRISSVRT